MSDRGYSIKSQHVVHFITFAVVQWVDARAGIFKKRICRYTGKKFKTLPE